MVPRTDRPRLSARLLAGAGIAAFLIGVVGWMPASVLAPFLPQSLDCARWSGRAWNGACDSLSIGPTIVGKVGWRLHRADLLRGRLAATMHWRRGDSAVSTQVSRGPLGALHFDNLQGHIDLATFRDLVGPRAASLADGLRIDGRIELNLSTLQVGPDEQGRLRVLQSLAGALIARRLQVIGFEPTFADIQVRWPGPSALQRPWLGYAESRPGAIRFSGTLSFPEGLGYRLEGTASAAGDTPATAALLRRLGVVGGGDVRVELSGRW